MKKGYGQRSSDDGGYHKLQLTIYEYMIRYRIVIGTNKLLGGGYTGTKNKTKMN